jgi:hypothetical protein
MVQESRVPKSHHGKGSGGMAILLLEPRQSAQKPQALRASFITLKTEARLIPAAALPTLNQLFDKVLALPGVGDIAKPVIDGVKAKLEAMSRL